jgi:hypothetical protein
MIRLLALEGAISDKSSDQSLPEALEALKVNGRTVFYSFSVVLFFISISTALLDGLFGNML